MNDQTPGLTSNDVAAWSDLELVRAVEGGHRNEVWLGSLNGKHVAVRRSRRSAESLSWELELLAYLSGHDVLVPAVVPTDSGASSADGIVVQQWIDGRPPESDDDWRAVADELQRLHRLTALYGQRPECCIVHQLPLARRSVDADLDAIPAEVVDVLVPVFRSFRMAETAVVHGDPWGPNIRITDDGRVGLLDWDESRVDVTWHDLSNLGVPVLPPQAHAQAERLSHAWETANGWVSEPTYAIGRLAELQASLANE